MKILHLVDPVKHRIEGRHEFPEERSEMKVESVCRCLRESFVNKRPKLLEMILGPSKGRSSMAREVHRRQDREGASMWGHFLVPRMSTFLHCADAGKCDTSAGCMVTSAPRGSFHTAGRWRAVAWHGQRGARPGQPSPGQERACADEKHEETGGVEGDNKPRHGRLQSVGSRRGRPTLRLSAAAGN
jgi:hypothetical protein